MVPETSKTIHSGSLLRHPSRSDPGPSSTDQTKIYMRHIMTQSNTEYGEPLQRLSIEKIFTSQLRMTPMQ